jgi:nucleotide-binding universal stress UspA family protein
VNGAPYVVGFDGSEGAKAALRWALWAAAPDHAPVEAVAAWAASLHAVSPWLPAPAVDESEFVLAFREVLRREMAGVEGARGVDLRVVRGAPGPTLVAAATHARCLAVGRRGHGGFAGLLLGSVADHCLRHSYSPVALTPVDDALRPDGSVVVGVDGSERSDAAVRFAAGEADRRGGRLVALHAWDWLAQPGAFDPTFDRDAAVRYAATAVMRVLGERPVDVVAVNDRPARALLERSAAGDLVIVGSRGLSAVRGSFVGSVSRQLAHHAPSTVVVVP